MTNTVKTSLVVEFSTNDHSSLSVEVDDREDGLNGGNTTFHAGDSPAFLVYASSDVTIKSVELTEGSVQSVGSGTRLVEEWITCARESSVSLKYPVSSFDSIPIHKGESLGGYTIQGRDLILPTKPLTVFKILYRTAFRSYRITGASGEAPVLVYVIGEKA